MTLFSFSSPSSSSKNRAAPAFSQEIYTAHPQATESSMTDHNRNQNTTTHSNHSSASIYTEAVDERESNRETEALLPSIDDIREALRSRDDSQLKKMLASIQEYARDVARQNDGALDAFRNQIKYVAQLFQDSSDELEVNDEQHRAYIDAQTKLMHREIDMIRQKLEDERKIRDQRLQAVEDDVQKTRADISEESDKRRENTQHDRSLFNRVIAGVLLALMMIYIEVFYALAAYRSFFQQDLTSGLDSMQNPLEHLAIFSKQAFGQAVDAVFPLIFPCLLFVLMFMYHVVKNQARYLAAGIVLVLDVTVALKVFATEKDLRIMMNLPAYDMGTFITVVLLVFSGIGSTFAAGYLLSMLMPDDHRLLQLRAFLESLEDQRRRIRDAFINEEKKCYGDIAIIEQEINKMQRDANKNDGVFVRKTFHRQCESAVRAFATGWTAYLTFRQRSTRQHSEALERFVSDLRASGVTPQNARSRSSGGRMLSLFLGLSLVGTLGAASACSSTTSDHAENDEASLAGNGARDGSRDGSRDSAQNGVQDAAQKSKSVDMIVAVDLSDRLIPVEQRERDQQMITALSKILEEKSKAKYYVNADDALRVFVIPQSNTPYRAAAFEEKMQLDMRKTPIQERRHVATLLESVTQSTKDLYTAAYLGDESKSYQGADIWKFFQERLPLLVESVVEPASKDQPIESGKAEASKKAAPTKVRRQKLILLTDGYVYFEDYQAQRQKNQRASDMRFIRQLAQQKENWRTSFDAIDEKTGEHKMGLLPVAGVDLKNIDVMVLEIAPQAPYHREILEAVWDRWLRSMGATSVMILDNTVDMTTLRSKISQFINGQ